MDTKTLLRGVSLSEEFACDLGDPRRTRRLQRVGERLALKPELSLPELFQDPSELEATYRLLRNSNVSLLKLISAHTAATAQRCQGLETVLAVHDTTEFDFGVREDHVREHLCRLSKSRQGFYGHLSLAVSADGLRAPLGVLNCFAYVHQEQVGPETRAFWDGLFGSYERESERWARAIVASEQRVGGGARVIHVCDREADMNAVLQTLHRLGSSYVIRAYQGRKTVDGTPVYEVPQRGSQSVRRAIELSARPVQGGLPKSRRTFAPRKARRAEVIIRGHKSSFPVDRQLVVDINVVEVLEESPPGGRGACALGASHQRADRERSRSTAHRRHLPLALADRGVLQGDYYQTGCSYEQRQLESASTLLAALGITLVLAWQLLVVRHLCRLDEERPDGAARVAASVAVTPQQLALLIAMTPKLKWPPEPTLCDVAAGISRLGGHHRSNGPPGWRVLGRGFQKLMAALQAVRLAAAAGLVIDP